MVGSMVMWGIEQASKKEKRGRYKNKKAFIHPKMKKNKFQDVNLSKTKKRSAEKEYM